jgi:hypothetical protein
MVESSSASTSFAADANSVECAGASDSVRGLIGWCIIL